LELDCELLGAMSDSQRLRLKQAGEVVHVRKGEIIARGGDTADHVWLILGGLVRLVCSSGSGHNIAVEVLKPGEVIGEMSLLTGQPIPEIAEALSSCRLYRIEAEPFRQLCRESSTLLLLVGQRVATRRSFIEIRLTELLVSPVQVRIARLLIHLLDKFREGSVKPQTFRLTHQEIADLVASSRETTTRALDEMMITGIVECGHRQIHVRSLPKLYACARVPIASVTDDSF
jgi:CRP/FNR family transcriptional regulator